MIKVEIIGCGFAGGGLKDWLEHNNPKCKLFINETHTYNHGPDGKYYPMDVNVFIGYNSRNFSLASA